MEFRRVGTTDEILSILSDAGPEATILAGGTDVMVQYLRAEISPRLLVHIEQVDEMRGTAHAGEQVAIGALTTHRELAEDPTVRSALPALATAAAQVGGRQTQAVGTVGGNLCNASPAADTAPPLLVADAQVQLRSLRGSRLVPLERFLLGRRRIDRRPDEVVTSILARPLPEHAAEIYLKVGRRGAMEVAVVGLAARLVFDSDLEVITDARLAVCSMAPRPLRLFEAESILVGSSGETEVIDAAAEAVRQATDPIDDPRASAVYRRRLIAPLLEEAVRRCLLGVRGEEVPWN